ncbi:NADH-quinone oxidoreductase subunit J [Iamia majanohamensis]|uniref:NADH-quinone oxidoreductase subunit J n=1 Tax=Iamia majanohamensis TaxID=467976 RepID=A0AAE9Y8Y4_9ACTN|nr:NADH-quinone oxidoreductase subunit J [Iamia majanohamensis]WCO69260.1 NADH-quinone oxidoreductase subunit J [Iamia majanohamensis]
MLASTMPLPGTDDPINVAQTIGFGVIAVVMVVSALRVVTTKNVVHAAMWLVLVLAGAAAQYVLLAAEFVAVTQVMVYIGAVVVLFLFGVMLTRARLGSDAELTRKNWYGAAFVGLILVGLLGFSLVDTFQDAKLPEDRQVSLAPDLPADATDAEVEAALEEPNVGSNTAAISDSLFTQYLVPLEVVAVLLTAALVGAIVIARRD